MPPRLDKVIKREVELDGELHTITLSPDGVHIAPKGKRKGHELSWRALASGETELHQALVRSVRPAPEAGAAQPKATGSGRAKHSEPSDRQ